MAKKQGTHNQTGLVVSVQPVPAPDAEERRRRAMEMLLRAAARKPSRKEKPASTRPDTEDGGWENGDRRDL